MDLPSRVTNPLIRKLGGIIPLSEIERAALEALPMQVTTLKTDQDITREGDRPSRCCLILEGFACSYKITVEGKRQILAYHIPGGMPDLQTLYLNALDYSVSTITPCRIGFIQHATLKDLYASCPRITVAFWQKALLDGAVFREWMINNGRREAKSGMAHLLCEMVVRLRAVGLGEDHSTGLPITQSEFADALGLTPAHVNRMLQELRAEGLISPKENVLSVLNWDGLKEVGDFDPAYLLLENGRNIAQ